MCLVTVLRPILKNLSIIAPFIVNFKCHHMKPNQNCRDNIFLNILTTLLSYIMFVFCLLINLNNFYELLHCGNHGECMLRIFHVSIDSLSLVLVFILFKKGSFEIVILKSLCSLMDTMHPSERDKLNALNFSSLINCCRWICGFISIWVIVSNLFELFSWKDPYFFKCVLRIYSSYILLNVIIYFVISRKIYISFLTVLCNGITDYLHNKLTKNRLSIITILEIDEISEQLSKINFYPKLYLEFDRYFKAKTSIWNFGILLTTLIFILHSALNAFIQILNLTGNLEPQFKFYMAELNCRNFFLLIVVIIFAFGSYLKFRVSW